MDQGEARSQQQIREPFPQPPQWIARQKARASRICWGVFPVCSIFSKVPLKLTMEESSTFRILREGAAVEALAFGWVQSTAFLDGGKGCLVASCSFVERIWENAFAPEVSKITRETNHGKPSQVLSKTVSGTGQSPSSQKRQYDWPGLGPGKLTIPKWMDI